MSAEIQRILDRWARIELDQELEAQTVEAATGGNVSPQSGPDQVALDLDRRRAHIPAADTANRAEAA